MDQGVPGVGKPQWGTGEGIFILLYCWLPGKPQPPLPLWRAAFWDLGPVPYKTACTPSPKRPSVPRGWEAQAGAGDGTVTSDLSSDQVPGGPWA